MEIRQNFGTVPSRPIAVALALLAVVALALTAWYVFHTQVGTSNFTQAPRYNHLPVTCTSDPFSPHDSICAPDHDPYSPHDPLS